MMGRRRAWLVCAGATLLMFTSVGVLNNAFTVFQPYIIARGGMLESQGSLLITIRYFVMLVCTLLVGRYYKIFGMRWGLTAALLPGVASLVLYSFVEGFIGCCVAAVLAGITCGFGNMLAATMLLDRWFISRRGLALGICAAGTGAAAVLLPPVFQGLLDRFGMAAALQCTAVFFLVAAAAVFFLVRERPEDLGLTPYLEEKDTQRDTPAAAGAAGKADRAMLAMLMPAAFLFAAPTGPGFSHTTVYLTSEGFQPETIAWLVSALGLTMTVGKCMLGQVTDWLGGRWACLIFGGCVAVGQFVECLVPTGSVAVAGGSLMLVGLGLSMSTVGFSVWSKDLCNGDMDALRKIQAMHMGGSMLLSSTPGMIADATGSYLPAYVLVAFMTTGSFLLMARAYFTKRPAKEKA